MAIWVYSRQNQNTRNAGREKERKAVQETRGDTEELTETRRVPQRRVPRWRKRVKPIGGKGGPGREVREEL